MTPPTEMAMNATVTITNWITNKTPFTRVPQNRKAFRRHNSKDAYRIVIKSHTRMAVTTRHRQYHCDQSQLVSLVVSMKVREFRQNYRSKRPNRCNRQVILVHRPHHHYLRVDTRPTNAHRIQIILVFTVIAAIRRKMIYKRPRMRDETCKSIPSWTYRWTIKPRPTVIDCKISTRSATNSRRRVNSEIRVFRTRWAFVQPSA